MLWWIGCAVDAKRRLRVCVAFGGDDTVGGTGYRVGEVIMRAGTVVDAVLARTRGAPFKTRELINEAVGLGQDDAAGIEHRQQVAE